MLEVARVGEDGQAGCAAPPGRFGVPDFGIVRFRMALPALTAHRSSISLSNSGRVDALSAEAQLEFEKLGCAEWLAELAAGAACRDMG